MSKHLLPPPPAPPCLERHYPSSQKGGTLISEDVRDLETHLKRICDPEGYRPPECKNCNHCTLHVHDYRTRVLAAEPDLPAITVIRYLCPLCKATWRILPVFVARHLWRSWKVVEANALDDRPPPSWPKVPERTRRRWRARLLAAARQVVDVLASSGIALMKDLARRLGLEGTREQLVQAYATLKSLASGLRLAELASLVHHLAPGARLM